MDMYIHRQNLALLRTRLAESQDEQQRAVILKLLAEEEAKVALPRRKSVNRQVFCAARAALTGSSEMAIFLRPERTSVVSTDGGSREPQRHPLQGVASVNSGRLDLGFPDRRSGHARQDRNKP